MEGHHGARVAPPERIYPKRFRRHDGTRGDYYTDTRPYWDGFVYGQWGPAFDLSDLRRDNGSAGRRADEMQSRRTRKWGIRQVTRCYTYPGGEILKALRGQDGCGENARTQRVSLLGSRDVLSVITSICVECPSRSSIRLLSEKPHAFAICPQGGTYFLGKVHALIDDHASFARRQPIDIKNKNVRVGRHVILREQ